MKKRTRKILIVVSTLIILFTTVFQASADMLFAASPINPDYGINLAPGIPYFDFNSYNGGYILTDPETQAAVSYINKFEVMAGAPSFAGSFESSSTHYNLNYGQSEYFLNNTFFIQETGSIARQEDYIVYQQYDCAVHYEPDYSYIISEQRINVHFIMPDFYFDWTAAGGNVLYIKSYGQSVSSYTEKYFIDLSFMIPGDYDVYYSTLEVSGSELAQDYTAINLKALLLESNLNLNAYRSTSVSDADYNQALQNYDPYLEGDADNDAYEAIIFGSLPTIMYIKTLFVDGIGADGTSAAAFSAEVENSYEGGYSNYLFYDGNFSILYPTVDETVVGDWRDYDLEYAGTDNYANASKYTKWIGHALSGFMDFQIMPNFSLGGLLLVIISFSCVLWWLKVFAGG